MSTQSHGPETIPTLSSYITGPANLMPESIGLTLPGKPTFSMSHRCISSCTLMHLTWVYLTLQAARGTTQIFVVYKAWHIKHANLKDGSWCAGAAAISGASGDHDVCGKARLCALRLHRSHVSPQGNRWLLAIISAARLSQHSLELCLECPLDLICLFGKL